MLCCHLKKTGLIIIFNHDLNLIKKVVGVFIGLDSGEESNRQCISRWSVDSMECFNKSEDSLNKTPLCMGDDLCFLTNWSVCCLWWS